MNPATIKNHWRHLRLPPLQRAEALTAKGDWKRAARAWRRLARDEAAPIAPTALAEYARCFLRLGQLAAARATLEKARQLDPQHPLANKLLGWVAAEQQDWPLAAAQWRGILAAVDSADAPAAAPALSEALQRLAGALIRLGEFAEADGLLARLQALGGDAEHQALRLEIVKAEIQMDHEGLTQAWRRRYERYPEAVRALPGWRGFVGLPDAGRYTPADLRQAPDAAAARRIVADLTWRHRRTFRERIALFREAVTAFPSLKTPAGRGLLRDYLWALQVGLTSAAVLEDLQRRLKRLGARNPEHQRLRMATAIVANEQNTVAALLEEARPRLGAQHVELQRAELWLAAQRGEHERAYRLAQDIGRKVYVLGEDGRGLDLHPLNKTPKEAEWRRRQDRILLFTNFRNEMPFAPWFLGYYRQLGVERFFIVDNLSDDGTADYLAAQKDVGAFASADHYGRAQSGIRWINELIRRYGQDNWCLLVDSDEELVLPTPSFPRKRESREQPLGARFPLDSRLRGNDGSSASPLRNFVDAMAARGEEVLPAYLLDTFPADLAAVQDFQPGDSPRALSNLIDTDLFFTGYPFCPFIRARGGVRDRLFGSYDTYQKAPILRGGCGPGGEPRLYLTNHNVNYARPSAQTAALLHHKLLREAIDMQQRDMQQENLQENLPESRRQDSPGPAAPWRADSRIRSCQRRHEAYRKSPHLRSSPDGAAQIPRGPATVPYEGPAQLHRLGLLGAINPPQAARTEKA